MSKKDVTPGTFEEIKAIASRKAPRYFLISLVVAAVSSIFAAVGGVFSVFAPIGFIAAIATAIFGVLTEGAAMMFLGKNMFFPLWKTVRGGETNINGHSVTRRELAIFHTVVAGAAGIVALVAGLFGHFVHSAPAHMLGGEVMWGALVIGIATGLNLLLALPLLPFRNKDGEQEKRNLGEMIMEFRRVVLSRNATGAEILEFPDGDAQKHSRNS